MLITNTLAYTTIGDNCADYEHASTFVCTMYVDTNFNEYFSHDIQTIVKHMLVLLIYMLV